VIEQNKIYNQDCVEFMNTLPNECTDLIIADPPYYKAINEKWDKQWKTEEEYLSWCQDWFNECVRILKPTGVFYCYGNFDILSKQKVLIFDKQLNFRQNITLSKGLRAIAGRTSDKLRMFPTASEYLLYYVKQDDIGLTTKEIEKNNFPTLRKYFQEIQTVLHMNKSEIVKSIGQQADHCFRYNSSQWDLPTEDTYNSICDLVENKMMLKPYKEIKNIFENERFVFNLPTGVTDVWKFIPDKVRYGHKTQKPKDITDRIILASSNKNDLVFIPFAGSGSEIESCIRNNRNYIATETNNTYIEDIINVRIDTIAN
jgi:DNA modification methylase